MERWLNSDSPVDQSLIEWSMLQLAMREPSRFTSCTASHCGELQWTVGVSWYAGEDLVNVPVPAADDGQAQLQAHVPHSDCVICPEITRFLS